jgi:hypothetical protein
MGTATYVEHLAKSATDLPLTRKSQIRRSRLLGALRLVADTAKRERGCNRLIGLQ